MMYLPIVRQIDEQDDDFYLENIFNSVFMIVGVIQKQETYVLLFLYKSFLDTIVWAIPNDWISTGEPLFLYFT